MIRRRFVNLVVDNYSTGERSLHRLDAVKHLFYPSTAKAEAAHDVKKNINGVPKPPLRIGTLRQLPPPTMNLGPFPTTDYPCLLDDTFLLLNPRTSDGRILHTSCEKGITHIYDAGAGSKATVPILQRRHRSPILLPLAGAEEEEDERVYAMRTHCNDPSFEVLDLGKHPPFAESSYIRSFAESSYIRSFFFFENVHGTFFH